MKRFTKSVFHAVRGVRYAGGKERNFQLELVAGMLVIALMTILPLTSVERALLIFAIVGVLALELTNTAVELVVDIVKPSVHPYARIIKDVMAAAVLAAAIGAAAIGWLVLSPSLLPLL
jgi:diacylglycerol kinase